MPELTISEMSLLDKPSAYTSSENLYPNGIELITTEIERISALSSIGLSYGMLSYIYVISVSALTGSVYSYQNCANVNPRSNHKI